MRPTPLASRRRRWARIAGPLALVSVLSACAASTPGDSIIPEPVEMVIAAPADSLRFSTLSRADYEAVAQELEIPVAAIRAVVEIEAGPQARGFNADNTPIINFDLAMFRQACARRGVRVDEFRESHAVVFEGPNKRKYGTNQSAQYVRLLSAMEIDTIAALEGTFWGMFQIGGFNWKICGCSSVREFVYLMAYSERKQLELFAAFMHKRNLVRFIRDRQWDEFSLRYNGPGYKKHAYDTRLAAAFARFSADP